MDYQVLARKWRPQTFQDVIGQAHVIQTLLNALKSERLAHAYLFSGPRGVGKTSVARILAKAVNCAAQSRGEPCNQCQSCREIMEGSSVDVQEIDGASNRGIDEIRELRENIQYMPSTGKYRVYIIDEVHMLTLPAFNALLKTLEEPPAHVKFIFATTEPHKVPVTILSRCQRFDFKRIPIAQIVSHLEGIAEAEGVRVSRSSLSLIAKAAEGGMRDAQSLLDQVVSFAGNRVEDRHVTDILGIIDRDLLFETSQAVIEGDALRCLEIVERIFSHGHDLREFYRALMEQFRNLLVCLVAPETGVADLSDADREEARRQAARAGREKLQAVLNLLIAREEDLRHSLHPRTLLETVLIQLCHLGEYLSFGELLERLEALEARLAQGANRERSRPERRASDPSDRPNPPAPSGTESWGEFLRFLRSRNRGMWAVLERCRIRTLDDKAVELLRDPSPFSAAYFEDAGNLQELGRHLEEFFGRSLAVRVAGTLPPPAPPVEEVPDTPDLPHAVRELMNTFEGELESDEPLKAGQDSA